MLKVQTKSLWAKSWMLQFLLNADPLKRILSCGLIKI
jgi:hypothetical protein